MLRQSALRLPASRRGLLFSTQPLPTLTDIKKMTNTDLLHFIRKAQSQLNYSPAYHPAILESLLEAQKKLHPEFQVIALFARCVYACKAAEIAAAMGYRVVLVYDESEIPSLAPQRAHHFVIVKNSGDVDSMMNGLQTFCEDTGIDPHQVCVDPGFDKLSESPALAEKCKQHGIKFAGPNKSAMIIAGDKAEMKKLSNDCLSQIEHESRKTLGIPGYTGEDQSFETLKKEANLMGFPVILKDAHGGGGMGNTIVNNDAELEAALSKRQLPGRVKKVFVEKFLIDPYHIEVQVAISSTDYSILGTRNCSDQINQQKVVENAPATHHKLDEIKKYADKIAAELKQKEYEGLVTLEFLIDQNGVVYFLEANPRIQVEHGITEECLDISLIQLKYWIASGKSVADFLLHKLQVKHIPQPDNLHPTHLAEILTAHASTKFAVEVRVESIEYQAGFDNSIIKADVTGEAYVIHHPKGAYMGIWNGSKVNTFENNALIALLIGKGKTQEEALQDVLKQLHELNIVGISTNRNWLIAYLNQILAHPEIECNTGRVKKLNANIDLDQVKTKDNPLTLGLAKLFKPTPGNFAASAKSLLPVKKVADEDWRVGAHY
jgi:acetyl/propionyl-CoA carboxylase alpha subunit